MTFLVWNNKEYSNRTCVTNEHLSNALLSPTHERTDNGNWHYKAMCKQRCSFNKILKNIRQNVNFDRQERKCFLWTVTTVCCTSPTPYEPCNLGWYVSVLILYVYFLLKLGMHYICYVIFFIVLLFMYYIYIYALFMLHEFWHVLYPLGYSPM
jgi:hypothetical protein